MESYGGYSYWILWMILNLCTVHTVAMTTWKETTACFGSDVTCSQYAMDCDPGQHIVVGRMFYGFKSNQQCLFGISDCGTQPAKICCNYKPTDQFKEFSEINRSNVIENCEGEQTCYDWAPRVASALSSSYVWIQYACVNDTSTIDMCTNKRYTGNEVFLQFNSRHDNNNWPFLSNEKQDCQCQISSRNCNEVLNITFVDTQLQLPQVDGSSMRCSDMAIEATHANQTFKCINSTATHFKEMVSFETKTSSEIISLRNISRSGDDDFPSKFLVHIEAIPESSIDVQCYRPGITAPRYDNCNPTAATSTLTTHTLFPTSTIKATHLPNTIPPSTKASSTLSQSSTSPLSISSRTAPIVSSTGLSPVTSSEQTGASIHTTSTLKASPSHTISSSSTISSSQSSMLYSTSSLIISTLPSSSLESSPTSPVSVSSKLTSPSSASYSTSSSSLSTTFQTATTLAFISSSVSTTSPTTTNPSLSSTIKYGSSVDVFTRLSSTQPAVPLSVSTLSPTGTTATLNSYNSQSSREVPERTHAHTSRQPTPDVPANVGTVTATERPHETTTASLIADIEDRHTSSALIIGLSVAAIIGIIILVGILMTCLWMRLKRKEAVRRHYVRNTNIFYSFPEDYNDGENTTSNNNMDTEDKEEHKRVLGLHNGQAPLPPAQRPSSLKNSVPFENYRIRPPGIALDGSVSQCKGGAYTSCDNFARDTSETSIDFVNNVASESPVSPTGNTVIGGPIGNNDGSGAKSVTFNTNENSPVGARSVTFDPSAIYAQVQKDEKTKF